MIISGSADNTATGVKRTKGFMAELTLSINHDHEPRFAKDDNCSRKTIRRIVREITSGSEGNLYAGHREKVGVCKILKKYELEKKIKVTADYEERIRRI